MGAVKSSSPDRASACGRRSPQLRLTIPEQVRAELKARAAAERRSVSDIAREALDRYLAP